MDSTDLRSMTVVCRQFLYTSVAGQGFVSLTSSGVPDYLAAQVSQPIDPFSVNSYDEGRALYVLEVGGVSHVAMSYLKKTLDDHQRPFIYNHTLLLSVDEYLALGAHPEVFEPKFIRPDGAPQARTSLESLTLDMAAAYSRLPSEEQLQQIKRYFPGLEQLAWVINAIAQRQGFSVAMGRSGAEIVQIIYSLLALLPPDLRITPFASFTPRPEYRNKFVFTVAPGDSSGVAAQITHQANAAQPPTGMARELAGAVHSGDAEKLGSLWQAYRTHSALKVGVAKASRYFSAGELKEAETQLRSLGSSVGDQDTEEGTKKEYEQLAIAIYRQKGDARALLAGLEESKFIGDKLGYIAQTVNDASLPPRFRFELAALVLMQHDPRRLDAGILAFLLENRTGLPELIAQGTISMDRLVPAMAASQQYADLRLISPVFRFDGSPSVLEAFEKKKQQPFFALLLEQLGRLDAFDERLQPFVAATLSEYIKALRSAFNQVFTSVLPRAQWQSYARRIYSVLESSNVDATMRRMAATWRSEPVRQQWNEFWQKLSRQRTGASGA